MFDGYLKLTDADGKLIEGESADKMYPKYIEIRDFSMGDEASVKKKSTDPAELLRQKQEAEAERQKQSLEAANKKQLHRKSSALSFDPSVLLGDNLPPPEDEDEDTGVRLQFSILKDVDAATADLFQGAAASLLKDSAPEDLRKLAMFQSATVLLRKMFDGVLKPYFVCTFKEVTLASYSIGFDTGRAHLQETVGFRFQEYGITYQAQGVKGEAAAKLSPPKGSLAKNLGKKK